MGFCILGKLWALMLRCEAAIHDRSAHIGVLKGARDPCTTSYTFGIYL